MKTAKSVRNAAYWGVVAIVISVFFSFDVLLSQIFGATYTTFAIASVALTMTMSALVFHLRGYGAIARKYNAPFLEHTTWITMTALAILTGMMVIALWAGVSPNSPPNGMEFMNAGVGLLFAVYYVAATFFAIAFSIFYRRVAALPSLLVLFVPIAGWYPWITALLFLPSTYLLFKESSRM